MTAINPIKHSADITYTKTFSYNALTQGGIGRMNVVDKKFYELADEIRGLSEKKSTTE